MTGLPEGSALEALLGAFPRRGRLRWIGLRPARDVPMQAVDSAQAVAGAGLKLLLGPEGSELRQRLLLTLVQGDHLHTDDLRALSALLGRTFNPRKLAGTMLQRLNPLAPLAAA